MLGNGTTGGLPGSVGDSTSVPDQGSLGMRDRVALRSKIVEHCLLHVAGIFVLQMAGIVYPLSSLGNSGSENVVGFDSSVVG